ncbi:AIM24 family protein, partial [Deinococcus sp. UYEF24]
MSSHRFKVSEQAGAGLAVEVYEIASLQRVVHNQGGHAEIVEHYHATGQRQVRFVLSGGGILLEPGAFLYSQGKIASAVKQHEKGGMFTRALRGRATGESAFATSFDGQGEVWTELTGQHFVIAELDGQEDMLLDDRAFYACQNTVQLSTHMHKGVSGVLSGNGFAQPRLSGRGLFVVESPVPAEEIEVAELNGEELILDGDLMLMYSAKVLAPFWCTWLSREHADSQQIEVGAAIHLPLD